ncbi:hypothetical protein P4283_18965 [Bacillus thuringiensis]|nr:hypothetical protein [Bacillus thuringiensis]
MLNKELLEALFKYRRIEGRQPNIVRVNPIYFRNLLEELNYPDWLIKKKRLKQEKIY